jgi:hypothetical protein
MSLQKGTITPVLGAGVKSRPVEQAPGGRRVEELSDAARVVTEGCEVALAAAQGLDLFQADVGRRS